MYTPLPCSTPVILVRITEDMVPAEDVPADNVVIRCGCMIRDKCRTEGLVSEATTCDSCNVLVPAKDVDVIQWCVTGTKCDVL